MKRIFLIGIIWFFLMGCVAAINAQRREQYILNHPELSANMKRTIAVGTIMIGMTKEQVIASWGRPRDINRTVTRYSTREQWVYGEFPYSTYIYFENNILTSWQD